MASIVLSAPLQGWVTALDDVPDAVFAGRMLGDGLAIDPTGDCLYAPCAGRIVSVQSTGHALTIEAENGAQILIHLGIDTVGLGGRGFTPHVRAGDRVATGDALIDFDLDLLVREAPAVITPILLVESEGYQITNRASVGPILVGAPLMMVHEVASAEGTTGESADIDAATESRILRIDLPHGIHARPAARIAACARAFGASITIGKDARTASALSPTGLLALGIGHGDTITLAAQGSDGTAALDALVALISGGMDEAPAPAAPPPIAPRNADVPEGALVGVTAAPGLAIGPVRHHRAIDPEVLPMGSGVAQEQAAFTAAHAALAAEMTRQAATANGPTRAILEAHAALLDDPALIDATRAGIARGESAGFAWRAAIRPQADALRAGGDTHLAERADDLRDLERQLLAHLLGVATSTQLYPAGTILIAEDLMPSDLIGSAEGLAGLCIAKGGPTSHVAILAASMGLPALVAIGPDVLDIADDTRVILDASNGLLHTAPSATQLAEAEAAQAKAAARRASALARAGVPCHTADGTRIEVVANLGSAAEAAPAVANGAEGCGLLRTEFLFLERDTAPSVAEQAAEYQAIADALEGRPLIVRLLDIGGDKPAPYLPIAGEENPALGLRGIRVGLAHPALLEEQLRAILSVQPTGQCKIMLPMVAQIEELRRVRALLDRLCAELGITTAVQLGIMVETPAAAVTADLLAREADFLSVGTNDLTQYTLAMDRANPAVASALDGLHPAVLRLIGETCRGGAAHGRWTGVCGGLASDPLAVPILLGLGVTELSTAPVMVPTIKALVSDVTLAACRDHAAAALACTSAAEVRALARTFATKEMSA
ncbi:phosphoenolpyruvate--protein phosphotransferase [Sphingomonas sp. TF3]|uniref:phosphoenolpyruvate--protein phosphotransferase n=1 Tax=Sphingomonas sp. TF3 TaxID=2495580 RepID=UPI000F882174|nr:phosphoenolpyruvate--protein phosphotransferase [Sphingomonas sp. TF3]RUN77917.1 phosphoenolpyruvate--protein phosphotransferase [Sphingomonas sp. TF3]